MDEKGAKMLTAKEVATRIKAGESSVRMWAKDGRFAGAQLVESPVGSYWLIPETALNGFQNPGRGRPPKQESAPKATKRKAAKHARG